MLFNVNPYDPRCQKKMINGNQTTIIWHINDLKVSHKGPEDIAELEESLTKLYGNVKEKRGKHHEYLGMDIYYSLLGVG